MASKVSGKLEILFSATKYFNLLFLSLPIVCADIGLATVLTTNSANEKVEFELYFTPSHAMLVMRLFLGLTDEVFLKLCIIFFINQAGLSCFLLIRSLLCHFPRWGFF